MDFQELTPAYDADLAIIIRHNLKAHQLDVPGNVYFDEGLEHLSSFYSADPLHRAYFIILQEGRLVGGCGLAEIDVFENCAELQKLYLDDSVKGHGLGYRLISMVEERARELGYRQIYLETHTNLQAAIHEYERSGYEQIERPASVVHSTMNRFYLKAL